MDEHSTATEAVLGVRPRLLIVSPVFPPARGGIETLSARVASGLDRFSVRVLTLQSTSQPNSLDDVPVERLPNEPAGGRRSLLGLNRALAAALLRDPADVVLAMHVRAAPAACLTRRRRAVPLVQYVHAKELLEFPETSRFILGRAQRVIAVSGYGRDLAVAAGASPDAVTVIPNGVDPAPARTLPRDAPPTILTISRLDDAYKGHDVMLAAMSAIRAAVPGVRWVIVGDGSLRAQLEAQAARRGLADVVDFVGAVDDASRDRWIERASVFAMPTREPGPGKAGEGFGIVFLEAAARGVPAVSGRVPGVVDAVEDGVSGILVDPEDPDAVARATIRLLTDGRLASRMGEQARLRSLGFSWASVISRVDDVLWTAMTEPRRARASHTNRVAFAREFVLGPR